MAGLTDAPPAAAEPVRLGALRELLDGGFGKATTILAGDGDTGALQIDFRWQDTPASPQLELTSAIGADDEATEEFAVQWADTC